MHGFARRHARKYVLPHTRPPARPQAPTHTYIYVCMYHKKRIIRNAFSSCQSDASLYIERKRTLHDCLAVVNRVCAVWNMSTSVSVLRPNGISLIRNTKAAFPRFLDQSSPIKHRDLNWCPTNLLISLVQGPAVRQGMT